MNGAPDPVEPTLIQQDGEVPETVIPAEPVVEAPEPEPTPEPVAAEPEKPKEPVKQPWFQKRIDELTRKKSLAEQEAARAKAEVEVLKAAPKPDGTTTQPGLTQAEFDRQVNARAEQIAQQKEWENRSQSWLNAGVGEYGMEQFNAKCAEIAAMGANERPEFIQLLTDPDVVPDGHKVVVALADKPEEVQRILALPPLKMAAALTKFGLSMATQEKKTVSGAPKPISPIGGTTKASAPSDTDDIKTWLAKRNATARTSAGGFRVKS